MSGFLHNILPADKAKELLSIGQERTIIKGKFFIREGEIPKKFAYVNSGLFRYLYIHKNGNEFTKGLITEHNFISAYSAMISQTPSFFYIEALEDSNVFEIPYPKWQTLLASDAFWVKFLLSFIEKGFTKKEKRERDLLLLDAESRYLGFLEEFPGLDKRISQGIVASYLGIQPESLSRIKKNLRS